MLFDDSSQFGKVIVTNCDFSTIRKKFSPVNVSSCMMNLTDCCIVIDVYKLR